MKWKQNQLDTNKQNVSSQIAAMNAATASVITLTSGTVLSTHFCFVLSLICLFYYYYLFFFSFALFSVLFIFTFYPDAGPPEDVDHQAVGAAISTISSNLPEMAKGVKLISALMEGEEHDDRLMDATRRLCKAFSDLLDAAKPENNNVKFDISSFLSPFLTCPPVFNYHSPSRRGISV